MKLVRSCLFWVACLGVVIGALGDVAPVKCDDLRPIIVLRSDDIRTTWRTQFPEFGGLSGFQYCMNNQIPITWACITSIAGNSSQGLTWSELKQYLSTAGGEVASHSINHVPMASTADYINEVTGSKTAIEAAMGPGYVCRSFMQPGTWTGDASMQTIAQLNNPIGQAIQSTYRCSMAYLGAVWWTGTPYYKYGLTNFYSVDYSSSLTVDSLNRQLDIVAGCPGTIFVVSCHGLQATGGTVALDTCANILQAFVQKVVALRASNQIRLMSYSDAMEQVFPDNINQVPDINVCNPTDDGSMAGPWRVIRGAHISSNAGMDGGRCIDLGIDNAQAVCGWLGLRPGRYEVSWYQRVMDGFQANSAVRMDVDNYLGSTSDPMQSLIPYAWYFNQQPSVWEQKRALFVIKENQIPIFLRFLSSQYAKQTSGCRVDGISLIRKPVDPAVSPSDVQVAPTPTGGTISWTTPNDPTITAIEIRYGNATHPIDGTSNQLGMQPNILLANVRSVLGARQTIPFTMNWSSQGRAYFSVFAKRDTNYSDPDIDYVIVPSGGPVVSISQVSPVVNGQSSASWSVQSPAAPVYQIQYALGRSPGAADVQPWTTAPGTSATFSVPQVGGLYVSVKADNIFGSWSNTDSKQVVLPASTIVQVKQTADDPYTSVAVNGTVTRIFKDYFYVEAPDRSSGLRILGSGSFVEGQTVYVSGTMDTINGERVLVMAP